MGDQPEGHRHTRCVEMMQLSNRGPRLLRTIQPPARRATLDSCRQAREPSTVSVGGLFVLARIRPVGCESSLPANTRQWEKEKGVGVLLISCGVQAQKTLRRDRTPHNRLGQQTHDQSHCPHDHQQAQKHHHPSDWSHAKAQSAIEAGPARTARCPRAQTRHIHRRTRGGPASIGEGAKKLPFSSPPGCGMYDTEPCSFAKIELLAQRCGNARPHRCRDRCPEPS